MAAKRFVKSSIDWAAFSERIRDMDRSKFQMFKLKSDGYLKRVMSYPENPPPINWGLYRSRIPSKALVEEFEKQYSSVKVQYPADKLSPAIDAQEKEFEKEMVQVRKESDMYCEYYNKQLNWWKNMLPVEEMTMDDVYDYFPDHVPDMQKRPSFWPHDEETGPIFPYRNKKHH